MIDVEKYCSSQVRIDQRPNYRNWRRVHGLQFPLHRLQIVGWLLLAFFIATTFAVLVPALGPSVHSPALFVLGCLFFLHCVSHSVALAIDPADYELRVREKAGLEKRPDFDRGRHAHVIENGVCHICNIRASSSKTKHCRLCNKCVERFDHHCKWLNQCIGARNYVAFLVCVVSAVLASLTVFSVCVFELVVYFGNSVLVDALFQGHGVSHANVRALQLPIPKYYFLTVVVAQTVLALVAAVCLLHLCLFHVYISALGLTTYEYIRSDQPCSAATSTSQSSPAIRNGLQSTPSSMAPFNAYPSGDRNTSVVNRSSAASDGNLASKPSGDGIFAALWRRRCGCRKSFAVDSAARTIRLKAENGTSNGGESAPGSLEYGYLKPRVRIGESECKYCKRANSGTFSHSTNGGRILRKAKNRRPRLRLCCSGAGVRSELGSFRSGSSGFSGGHRPNQIKPLAVSGRFYAQNGDSARNRILIAPRRSNSLNSLPALPSPARRQAQSVSLKELNEILAFAQRPQSANNSLRRPLNSVKRQLRRKSNPQLKQTKTLNLSPIHESGLSNPSTPHFRDRLNKPKELSPLTLNSRL